MKNHYGFVLGQTYDAANGSSVRIERMNNNDFIGVVGMASTSKTIITYNHDGTVFGSKEEFNLTPPPDPRIAELAFKRLESLEDQHLLDRVRKLESHTYELQKQISKLEGLNAKLTEENAREFDQIEQRFAEMELGVELLNRGHPMSYSKPPADFPTVHRIAYDGFQGTVVGHYTTREGKEGVVLQAVGSKVVHVYNKKHLEGK